MASPDAPGRAGQLYAELQLRDAPTLIGRVAELEAMRSVLAPGRRSPRALALVGDPGVGKSSLLLAFEDVVSDAGAVVLHSSGNEAESALSYAGLDQLTSALLKLAGNAAPISRDALMRERNVEDAELADGRRVGEAIVNLVRAVSADRPVVVVVDDAQWLDTASARVLSFVARRLDGDGFSAFIAMRPGSRSPFAGLGIPELPIGPLSSEDAVVLAEQMHPDIEHHLLAEVVVLSEGNPLAIEELPRALASSRDSFAWGVDGTVALTERLERIFRGRFAELSEAERDQVLRLALDGTGERAGHLPSGWARFRPEDVPGAVESGLLVVDPTLRAYRFRHPLVRSAVVQSSSPDEVRSAHRSLAQRYESDPERYAWHLAAATLPPDEEVAETLERAAAIASARGGARAAVDSLIRAADFSMTPDDRAHRLAVAAHLAAESTQVEIARDYIDEVAGSGTPDARLEAIAVDAYMTLIGLGDVHGARRMLIAAMSDAADLDVPATALASLYDALLVVCVFADDRTAWDDADAIAARISGVLPERSLACRDAWGRAVEYRFGLRNRVIAELDRSLRGPEPWNTVRLALASFSLDAHVPYRAFLRRILEKEIDSGGAMVTALVAIQILTLDAIWEGDYAAAVALAARCRQVSEAHNCHLFRYNIDAVDAIARAITGDPSALDLVAGVAAWPPTSALGPLIAYELAARSLFEASQLRWDEAYEYAAQVCPIGDFERYPTISPRMFLNAVEFAVAAGRTDEARAHVATAEKAGAADLSSRLRLLVAGAKGLVEDDDETAVHLLADALAIPTDNALPFERARLRLHLGRRLRHLRQLTRARSELRAAANTFQQIGATTWVAIATQELGAAGEVDVTAIEALRSNLTPQESAVAQLAAEGHANRDIGTRLYLSTRTVESHLYRVFRKLGVANRAELAALIRGSVQ